MRFYREAKLPVAADLLIRQSDIAISLGNKPAAAEILETLIEMYPQQNDARRWRSLLESIRQDIVRNATGPALASSPVDPYLVFTDASISLRARPLREVLLRIRKSPTERDAYLRLEIEQWSAAEKDIVRPPNSDRQPGETAAAAQSRVAAQRAIALATLAIRYLEQDMLFKRSPGQIAARREEVVEHLRTALALYGPRAEDIPPFKAEMDELRAMIAAFSQ
jgi:hypothetical protein